MGKRLVRRLVERNFEVICCVRDLERISLPDSIIKKVDFLEIDFLKPLDVETLPKDIDGAFYLIHSMSQSIKNFTELESEAAQNFRDYMNMTHVKHVVYLSGIVNSE